MPITPPLLALVAIISTPITAVLCAWLGYALGRTTRPTPCQCDREHPPTPPTPEAQPCP